MRRLALAACLLAIAGLVAAAPPAKTAPPPPTLEEVCERMKKAAAELKTYSADERLNIPIGGGVHVWGTGHVTALNIEKDGKTSRRYHETATIELREANGGALRRMTSKTVYDGVFIWRETKTQGSKVVEVVKTPAFIRTVLGLPVAGDPYQAFETWKQRYNLKVIDVRVIDGRRTVFLGGSIKGTPFGTDPDGLAMRDAVNGVNIWLDEKDLLPRIVTSLSNMGIETMRISYDNVKLNAKVDEKLFAYTPPKGAVVYDFTDALW